MTEKTNSGLSVLGMPITKPYICVKCKGEWLSGILENRDSFICADCEEAEK